MKSLYWMVSGVVRSGKSGCRDGFECAPDLLRRFACALREYQRDRRDRFPLEAHLIDWLADEEAEEFLNLINLHCRLGERLVVNMADPEVAAFPVRYAARVHS